MIKDQPLSEKHQRWDRQRTTLVICIHRDKSIESLASSLVVLPRIEAVEDLCDGKKLKLAPSGESAVGLVALARDAGGSTLLKLKAPLHVDHW